MGYGNEATETTACRLTYKKEGSIENERNVW